MFETKNSTLPPLRNRLLGVWQYITIATLIVVFICREVLWFRHWRVLAGEVDELTEIKETLLFRLQVDQLTQYSCDNNMTLSFNNSTLSSSILDANRHSSLAPLPSIYDWFGIVLIAGFCVVIGLENYCLHDVNNKDEHDPAFAQILHRVNDFVLRKHPVTGALLALLILLSVPWAWLGLVDRSAYVDAVFKVAVTFSCASLLFFVVHNAHRLSHYMPRDREEWLLKVRDGTWWLWLLSRVLGVYDLPTGTTTVLWMACVLWFSWPFRYFYYYRYAACGSAAADPTTSVFLINMVGHAALLSLLCLLLYLLILVPPLPASGKDVPVGYDNAAMRLWTWFHRRAEQSSFVALLSVLSLLNSLLALARVLWFVLLTSRCGFYASCVAWMFVHMHIVMSVWTVPVVNALIERLAVVGTHRAPFVQRFCEAQRQDGGQEAKADEDSGVSEALAGDLFDNVLALSTLHYVFVHPYVREATAAADQAGGKEAGAKEGEEGVRLVGVFQAMLQTEIYASQQRHNEEGEGQENVSTDDQTAEDSAHGAAEEVSRWVASPSLDAEVEGLPLSHEEAEMLFGGPD